MSTHTHFISIGGEVMHSLAIALQAAGHVVTGSDDKIYNPSRATLQRAGLLPVAMGWDVTRIHKGLHSVVVGMHAKKDNPELLRAKEMGIPIFSYPAFIARYSQNKQRIVVGGSHGKTTTTAMIMHVLKQAGVRFDYLVGASVPGFSHTVSLHEDSVAMVIEGDEYPSGPLDLNPKFCQYNHHIAVVTGIAWDHINYYPTFAAYKALFHRFVSSTPKGGAIVYNANDKHVRSVIEGARDEIKKTGFGGVEKIPYKAEKVHINEGISYVGGQRCGFPLRVFGRHNTANMEAARLVVERMAIERDFFYKAIASFSGVSRRLSHIHTTSAGGRVFSDYAHAPSKVSASTRAVKEQYPTRPLVAVLELHTFSSLSHRFTAQYKDSLHHVDVPIVYIDQEVLAARGNHTFGETMLREKFNKRALMYLTAPQDIFPHLKKHGSVGANYLFMSSGDFGGLDIKEEVKGLV